MKKTIPNKEIVRRLCHLSGATDCYMLADTDNECVEILANIPSKEKKNLSEELEAWGGMKFRVYSLESLSKCANNIRSNGVRILPIEL